MKFLMPIFFITLVLICVVSIKPVRAQEEQSNAPQILYNGPVYPEKMLNKNMMGHVEIISDIDTKGHNVNCHIIFSTNSGFNQSALEYCQRARYLPARKDGVPVVEQNHHMTINFKLDN